MKTGLVIKSTGSNYLIEEGNEIFNCVIKGKFRLKGIKTTNPVAVGDIVDFKLDENDTLGVIQKIHTRRNYIIRKSTNLSKQAQIIAANVDLAFLMISLISPKTHIGFIDRFLVSCEAYKVPAVLIFNKTDIHSSRENEQLSELTRIYSAAGYQCFEISVKENINIDKIINCINDKTIVISGNSGVGKSSLINKIQPGLKLKTAEVSDFHRKGKHTTTFAELFKIANGRIIDTPGVKAFGLSDMPTSEVSHYFPEIFKLLKYCKYHNCTHTHEPDCAVKAAVEDSKLAESRYCSYLNILSGDDNKYRQDIYKI